MASSTLLPRLKPSRAKAPVSSARWPRPQRKLFTEVASTGIRWIMLTCLSFYSGVAVGSSIGHAIGGMFGGSSAPAEPQQAAPVDSQPMDSGLWQSNAATQSYDNAPCATDIKSFRQCMDDHRGDMSICGWYLDQLVCYNDIVGDRKWVT
ncbi:uncharacterized protein ASPGLDRAFT_301678 [Aspergillus glaucus CBS 516.65]|uniref:CHCH domain-containing protein n=1 Tax=Aspergillus glaucus CBS 516.65 TaxID=1160497 RepID=A0A1L9VJX7_ASPGL|nr:hypothetical protein ASPGLDRAFT_301678 [Aspergillus glaucus CBS 516.65]OJJ84204.1 hypothetical protein ASPGLDRAFT_301678 [Aspergillus glaucus CBS 516.65]